MKAIIGLLAGLLNITLVLAGIFYAGEVLVNFLRSGQQYRPAISPEHPFRSAGQLLIGAGVLLTAAVVTLARPIVAVLAEASAEVGEWALEKRQSQATVRHHNPVGGAA